MSVFLINHLSTPFLCLPCIHKLKTMKKLDLPLAWLWLHVQSKYLSVPSGHGDNKSLWIYIVLSSKGKRGR